MFAQRILAPKFAKYATEVQGFMLGCKCLLPAHEAIKVVAWRSRARRIKLRRRVEPVSTSPLSIYIPFLYACKMCYFLHLQQLNTQDTKVNKV